MLAYMENYQMSNCEIEAYGRSMFAIRPLAVEYDAICPILTCVIVRHKPRYAYLRRLGRSL